MSETFVIRPEEPRDVGAIFHITELAFKSHPYSQQTEQFIIDALRRAGALSISLVAEVDGCVVGHVAFSPVEISDGSRNWYALGPIAVTPERQRRGIGQSLVKAGLTGLRDLGADGCVLVGEPRSMAGLGFVRFPDLACTVCRESMCLLSFLAGIARPGRLSIMQHSGQRGSEICTPRKSGGGKRKVGAGAGLFFVYDRNRKQRRASL